MLTDEDIQEIVRLLDELPYQEMRLTTRHFTLSLRRTGGAEGGWSQATQVGAAPDEPVAHAAAPEPGTDGLVAVRAPLLGTFYRAPKPGAPPFVEVGSPVTEETVVGILETMKLMNSVYAGARGRVAEIRVADAEFADHDAILMLIEPEPA